MKPCETCCNCCLQIIWSSFCCEMQEDGDSMVPRTLDPGIPEERVRCSWYNQTSTLCLVQDPALQHGPSHPPSWLLALWKSTQPLKHQDSLALSLFSHWVMSLSHVWHFAIPWTAAHQASLSFTLCQSCSSSCLLSRWCYLTISSSQLSFG